MSLPEGLPQRVHIAYYCPDHGPGVQAIDRIWCWECAIVLGVWQKVEHYVDRVSA